MSRRKISAIREITPDWKFNSQLVAKFINAMMIAGKRNTAEGIVYGALDIIKEKTGEAGINLFKNAVGNVKPMLEVKSRRVGGANYQVPVDVRPERQLSLAFRWLREAARSRKGQAMQVKLAAELMEAANNQGAAVKKREDVHRMAEANKAFAHYKW
jgi:small subunit ribosomal protein S7